MEDQEASAPPMTMEQLQQLIQQREELEHEIEGLNNYLNAPGNPGLRGGLVDKDGFPIADVQKILSIRESRNLLYRKQTDHVNIMKKIEEGLYTVHAEAKRQKELKLQQVRVQVPQQQKSQSEQIQSKANMKPFARISGVIEESPASKAGLKHGDLLLQFSTVNYTNHNQLKGLANVVKFSENTNISVTVLRGDLNLELVLIPQKWEGKGLVGCTFVPLNN